MKHIHRQIVATLVVVVFLNATTGVLVGEAEDISDAPISVHESNEIRGTVKPYQKLKISGNPITSNVQKSDNDNTEIINGAEAVKGEVIVKFKSKKRTEKVRLQKNEKVEDAVVRLKKEKDDIEYVEPNYVATALHVPNDLNYRYQWHLDNVTGSGIEAEEAWEVSKGQNITIAVIDTGIAYENFVENSIEYRKAPDLTQTCFVKGVDLVNNDDHPNDDNSHGTHVAGTLAQSTNNVMGVAGVAFRSCLMPVKVLDRNGNGSYQDVTDGIIWAVDHGAKVINLSLGGPSPSKGLEDALRYAYEQGVVIVAAAGNSGNTSISYPAAYDNYVIAVGATRYDKNRASYSSFGESLDLMAPGGDMSVDQSRDGYADGILQNTFNPNTKNPTQFAYWFFQGTSMSVPHVSGAAALVLSNGNATTPDTIKRALESSAEDLGVPGKDNEYGAGLLDIAKALEWKDSVDTDTPPLANIPPIANAGSDTSALVGESVLFSGATSTDNDGEITNYSWDFGDSTSGLGVTTTHAYSVSGVFSVVLTVTDNKGATSTDSLHITVSEPPTAPLEVFSDSFEINEWNNLWTEDIQNDFFRTSVRRTDGLYSAEVRGYANNSLLISNPINLEGRTSTMISFNWLIEASLDSGEYLAFDASLDNGGTWKEYAILRGNVDPENIWQTKTLEINNLVNASLRIRFRGKMSLLNEEANIDNIKVTAQ